MPRPVRGYVLEAEVLIGPKGKGCRVLSRPRALYRLHPSRLWATRHGIRCVPGFNKLHPELHARVVGQSDELARPPAMKQAAVIALCTRQESERRGSKAGRVQAALYN